MFFQQSLNCPVLRKTSIVPKIDFVFINTDLNRNTTAVIFVDNRIKQGFPQCRNLL